MYQFLFSYLIMSLMGSSNGEIIFKDDFSKLPRGRLITSVVGAHLEYHYFPAARPKGAWSVSCFHSNDQTERAWEVRKEKDRYELIQDYPVLNKHWHPMVVAGDELWRDYQVVLSFRPESSEGQCGLAFRYKNDRCYYFFGVDEKGVILKMVKHATALHKPYEKILDRKEYSWEPGKYMKARVKVEGDMITGELITDGKTITCSVRDNTYDRGKIGLTSDVRARFDRVEVSLTREEKEWLEGEIAERERELRELQSKNPKPVVWKKIETEGFGVGRCLRFGDLDGDEVKDVLIGQVLPHGPKNKNNELSCLTAMTFDGEILWRIGEPDPWKINVIGDLPFQIHDLNGDGKNEVIYCMNMEIIVAEGATGKTIRKVKNPIVPPGPNTERFRRFHPFERLLANCFYFCDLRGSGKDQDIIIKDKIVYLWALNDKLEIMWRGECNTGHYPYAYDVDNDGKDELMMGYTLFDDNGEKLWTHDDELEDHADGVAIVKYREDMEPRLMCAASDEGMFFTDIKGNILKHYYIGHVQNPAIANFRDDLPGLETVSINFWENQSIIHFYDSEGEIYHSFEPINPYGSMCIPINWTGETEEYFVLKANVELGGMYDGYGRKVVEFPDDGHPDQCYAVMHITGDCRDEIVVWDPYEIWVYTQDDNPKKGKLYNPTKNPLYNFSNYLATVSLPPDWPDASPR